MEKDQEKSPREKVVCGVSGPTFQEEVSHGPQAEVPGVSLQGIPGRPCQVKVNQLLRCCGSG